MKGEKNAKKKKEAYSFKSLPQSGRSSKYHSGMVGVAPSSNTASTKSNPENLSAKGIFLVNSSVNTML